MNTAVINRPAAAQREVLEEVTHREIELGGIIDAYNRVTEKLKSSHDALTGEVRRLTRQIEQKDRELQRRERLAALGEMAAGVAHEVRNPLGGILLYATLLERDMGSSPESRRIAERIVSAARHLDGVVGDVLAFSSPQPPSLQPVALNELASEVIDLLEPRRIERGCTVSLEAPESAVIACAEPAQLQRALLNVVSNAIDAAGRGGHVWVTLHSSVDDEFVRIEIADDGPGVAEEHVERIFNPFFTTKDSGTGLGLAIVHGIIEAHGGTINVGTRAGGGAVFGISLPASGSEG